ncbi:MULTISPECIES: hypothetical protein [Bacillus]|uniref:Uncharacterized protein n=1 Tax=Bacillus mycoides TaxID=1405 RepID=A0AAP7W4P8_BACMY|nr:MULTISPECIES: hypothetical protein [Bacillus]OSX90120.1 hypothetical protein S3E15_02756 [Bacillus mycoides]
MKVARTVLSGGKDGDNFKVLPIAVSILNKAELENSVLKINILRTLFF